MDYYVFRNYTVESLFSGLNAGFSGYGDITVINPDAGAYIWFYMQPIEPFVQANVAGLEDIYSRLILVVNSMPPGKFLYIFKMALIFNNLWEIADTGFIDAVEEYNRNIGDLAKKNSNVKIIDFPLFLSSYSKEELIDWKYYYISQMLINPKLGKEFKAWFTRKVEEINSIRKKCIVLDLDNTLWGGIIGEDGPEGIQLGNSYPGSAYIDFQKALLEASRNGVILAICSKNNELDIHKLWDSHQSIILKKEHFSCSRINWTDKASNIKEIASELNIGIDSMVFIDDNPVERELVRSLLPTVIVPEFPAQPYMLISWFKGIYEKYFSIYKLTDEDRNKTEQYRLNAGRDSFKQQFTSVDEYIASLGTEVTISLANEYTIPRIAQMTQKTNQFNLTTKRYNESGIRRMIDLGYLIYTASVKDKFGDNGITALCIIDANKGKNIACIDSYLLSCRILGRNIEKEILRYIISDLKKRGFNQLYSLFLPTPKNSQTEFFYDSEGFKPIEINTEKKEYVLSLIDYDYEPNTGIRIYAE